MLDLIRFSSLIAGPVSAQPQPWRYAFAQRAQQFAGNKTGDADADHADDDLLVRAADIRVPDEETQPAAAGAADLAAPAGNHFRCDHDLPGDAHADRGADHD